MNKIGDEDIIVLSDYITENNGLNMMQLEYNKQFWKKKENLYCNNCGKSGHIYKKCYEPILSYGIVCLNFNNVDIDNFCISKYKFPDNIQQLKNICTLKYIQKNISCNNNKDLELYEDKIENSIEVIMVRTKKTYNYIYLIRGLYTVDLENIIQSINLLTKQEYENILTKDFSELWWELSNNIIDYNNAKEQFNLLITYIIPQIQHRINIKYDYPEWEFPKGTRTNNETNLECAIRNFKEETGLKCDKYTILDRLYPLTEIKQGLDGINYKHIYYIAVLNNNLSKIDLTFNNIIKNNIIKNNIENIQLYSIGNSLLNIREYNIVRLELIKNLKLFLIYNIRYLEKFYNQKN